MSPAEIIALSIVTMILTPIMLVLAAWAGGRPDGGRHR